MIDRFTLNNILLQQLFEEVFIRVNRVCFFKIHVSVLKQRKLQAQIQRQKQLEAQRQRSEQLEQVNHK